VRQLAVSDNHALRSLHLDDLCAGRVMGGVAFSHLRRPGPPAMVATGAPGGFRVDGEAPWVTSWGLAGLFLVAARLEERVLWFLLDARGHDAALRPSAPLPLAAMNASSTVRLALDGLHVPHGDVLAVESFEAWQERDRVTTAQPNPAALGIAATCLRLLADADPDGDGRAAASLGDELQECRDVSYGLADDDRTDPGHVAALVEARAWGLALALRAAGALVAGTGGRALTLDHPAQRLLREAAFFSIQAQTPALRRALLAQLVRS
jgi:alkylation response protein AidB-like acyl-CoA dehydrogenase